MLQGLSNSQLAQVDQALYRKLCHDSLIAFIRHVAPWFIVEEIHIVIARHLEMVAEGRIDRLMIFMPPRTGKSMMASVFFPAWQIGRNPSRKVMQLSHTEGLAIGFSKNVREIVASEEYHEIFPDFEMAKDARAGQRWAFKGGFDENGAKLQAGEYYAAGAGTAIAGKGFNTGIIDDPLSEQDIASKLARDRINAWYPDGFYTRRQPGDNAILLMMTRWTLDDLAGDQLARMEADLEADDWTVLSVPGILDREAAALINNIVDLDGTFPEQERYDEKGLPTIHADGSFQPRRIELKELQRSKNNMSEKGFAAQYQQQPIREEGQIFKKQHWRMWGKDGGSGIKGVLPKDREPPKCVYTMAVYDTAFEEDEVNDYSARSTWGVFWHENADGYGQYNVVLLEKWKKRVEAADLLDIVKTHQKEYDLDQIVIEKRASGHQLIQELRRGGAKNIHAWLPPGGSRHNKGKIPLAHAAQVVHQQGVVWYMDRDWSEEMIEECADFPSGHDGDDLVNTFWIALLYLRRKFWLDLPSDAEDEDEARENARIRAAKGRARRSYGGSRHATGKANRGRSYGGRRKRKAA